MDGTADALGVIKGTTGIEEHTTNRTPATLLEFNMVIHILNLCKDARSEAAGTHALSGEAKFLGNYIEYFNNIGVLSTVGGQTARQQRGEGKRGELVYACN